MRKFDCICVHARKESVNTRVLLIGFAFKGAHNSCICNMVKPNDITHAHGSGKNKKNLMTQNCMRMRARASLSLRKLFLHLFKFVDHSFKSLDSAMLPFNLAKCNCILKKREINSITNLRSEINETIECNGFKSETELRHFL